MTTAQVPAPAPGSPQPARFHTYPQLLDLAAADGTYRRLASNLPQLRARYCDVRPVRPADAQPCASCGSRSSVMVDGVPLHPGCFDPPPEVLAGLTAAAPPPGPPAPSADGPGAAAAPGPHNPAGGAGEHLLAVLAGDGLWLPGAQAPVQVPWPQDAASAYALAAAHQVRQLWIHPSAHLAMGLPAERDEQNPQRPQAHPWTDVAGVTCDPPGLAAWVHVQPAGEHRRRALVFTGYERADRANWKQASTGQVLLAAVQAFNELMPPGGNYYYSPNQTSAAVIRHHNRGKLTVVDAPPPALARVNHIRRWSRVLTSDEDGAQWLHQYDVNGQQLATWNVSLGTGPADHVDAPEWTAACRRMPGYWLAQQPAGWRPDPLLPDLLIPWQRAGTAAVWLPTPYLELLDDLGAPISVEEAWVWRTSSAWLQAPGKTFRQARAALTGRDDEPARVALAIVKQVYTARIGAFSPHDPDPGRIDELVRYDVTDALIGKAFCNDYRRIGKIGKQSGRWPVAVYADSAYYAADDPDPVSAAPAGLVIGTGLGEYSVEATIPMGVVAAKLGEAGLQAEIERFLRGPHR